MLALFTWILLSFRLFFTSGMRGARLNQATKAMKKEKVCATYLYEIKHQTLDERRCHVS
jgi:hypothetical protein